ncbi:MAG: alpha/beta hydrolase [Gammaproteobacteria bacterium]|nr:alpha/beta hydrolase [Gammaproteobacteria bacterium]MDH5800199.1 alpha/beta hydrolase [Gammaproteobacteria bacterium]
MDTLLNVLKIAAIAYIAMLALLYFMQPGLIYYPKMPSREIQATPGNLGLAFEDVTLNTRDGISLHAWYIPHPNQNGVLLFFHGNAGNISHRLDSIQLFHQLGFSVFIPDYRGYGRSQGSPSESGTYKDADAAIEYLTQQRGIASETITVFGRSLGGAIAGYTAANYPVAGLILESTFTSAKDMAARVVPWPVFPVRLLSRYSYDSRKRLEQIQCPILIVHSPEDEVIPYAHGLSLYETAQQPKQLLTIHGGHNDGFLLSGDIYKHGLKQFLSNHVYRRKH